MLRDGTKAFVRHYETELLTRESVRLTGFSVDGGLLSWCESGYYYASSTKTDYDIIGMYPETHIVHGVEVPDLRFKPKRGEEYYLAAPTEPEFTHKYMSTDDSLDSVWVERGLCYENTKEGKQAAILHAKAMLGINPYNDDNK